MDERAVETQMNPPVGILERLDARDAARKAELSSSRRNRTGTPKEVQLPALLLASWRDAPPTDVTSSNFLATLIDAKARVTVTLNHLADLCRNGQPSLMERTNMLDEVLSEIDILQKWFTESSPHLKSFNIEQAHAELSELRCSFHEVRESVLPKEKFSFGAKARKAKDAPKRLQSKPLVSVSREGRPESTDKHLSLCNIRGPANLRLPLKGQPDEGLFGQCILLSDLSDCCVYLEAVSGSLMMQRLSNCRVYVQPVASSVLIRDSTNCLFVLTCRQLRIHTTRDSRFDLFVASPPIIEESNGLQFAPYPLPAAHSERFAVGLLLAGLSDVSNHWCEVQDFECPTLSPSATSKNWQIVPDSEWSRSDIPLCPSD